jgi:hypothetical protein
MLDAFAGLFYTFFMTLAILCGLKILLLLRFRGSWTPLFESVQHRLEATAQQKWRPKDQYED